MEDFPGFLAPVLDYSDHFVSANIGLEKLALSVRTLRAAEADVDPEPSDAAKDAGNYKKGHVSWKGLDITIETAAGQQRRGIGKDGKPWQNTLRDSYGYFKRTESEADGDHVDVFLCRDHLDSELVFVIDQVDPESGAFDEHKILAGVISEEQARAVYLRNYSRGWQGLGAIHAITLPAFKRWLLEGDTGKPFRKHASEDNAEYQAESEAIRGRKKKAGAVPHKFRAAEWTHKNGHPRCYYCGDEETLDGQCAGATTAVIKQAEALGLVYPRGVPEETQASVRSHQYQPRSATR